jgi:ketosteroid isomerase-like protein
MRRAPIFVAIAFLAGFGIGYFVRGATTVQQKNAHAPDLAGIEKLHHEDIEVTLSQDPKGLMDIWTEDAVRYSAGKPPVVGRQAIGDDNAKGLAPYPGFKVLSYVPKFKNIQVQDDLATEWFEAQATFKLSPDGPPNTLNAKGLRVMRRQADGSWKFVVLILDQ